MDRELFLYILGRYSVYFTHTAFFFTSSRWCLACNKAATPSCEDDHLVADHLKDKEEIESLIVEVLTHSKKAVENRGELETKYFTQMVENLEFEQAKVVRELKQAKFEKSQNNFYRQELQLNIENCNGKKKLGNSNAGSVKNYLKKMLQAAKKEATQTKRSLTIHNKLLKKSAASKEIEVIFFFLESLLVSCYYLH